MFSFLIVNGVKLEKKSVFFIREKKCVFHSCVFVFYMNSTIWDIYFWYIFSNKGFSNDIAFFISDTEGLFKWFAHGFVLLHYSSGNKEEFDYSCSSFLWFFSCTSSTIFCVFCLVVSLDIGLAK